MIRFILILAITAATAIETEACTSAIISAEMSPYGRPLLWKHRDTSTTDNKVEYVPSRDGSHAYVALFNAKDKALRSAWIGMNAVGFAIMNTASYNLKDDKIPSSMMDREGIIMSEALKTCRTVDDFGRFLDHYPRPLGVEANFGVIDAEGNGAYFETNNHSFVRFDLKEAEDGVLVRTNYSHSGRKGEGHGYVREANARHLLEPYIARREVTPEVLTEVLSRSFYRDTEKHDFSDETEIIDNDFIPRFTSTATVVIEGCIPVACADSIAPGSLADAYVMWTGMGYPPCSEIMPVFCTPEGVPQELRGLKADGHCEMGDRVKQRRTEIFKTRKGEKKKRIDMKRLFNEEGTGYVQVLTRKNRETYEATRRALSNK